MTYSTPSLQGIRDDILDCSVKMAETLTTENARLRSALEAVARFGDVNLSGEWEGGLRDIISSMTDCARSALANAEFSPKEQK